jgi:hypothetical protein
MSTLLRQTNRGYGRASMIEEHDERMKDHGRIRAWNYQLSLSNTFVLIKKECFNFPRKLLLSLDPTLQERQIFWKEFFVWQPGKVSGQRKSRIWYGGENKLLEYKRQ